MHGIHKWSHVQSTGSHKVTLTGTRHLLCFIIGFHRDCDRSLWGNWKSVWSRNIWARLLSGDLVLMSNTLIDWNGCQALQHISKSHDSLTEKVSPLSRFEPPTSGFPVNDISHLATATRLTVLFTDTKPNPYRKFSAIRDLNGDLYILILTPQSQTLWSKQTITPQQNLPSKCCQYF